MYSQVVQKVNRKYVFFLKTFLVYKKVRLKFFIMLGRIHENLELFRPINKLKTNQIRITILFANPTRKCLVYLFHVQKR